MFYCNKNNNNNNNDDDDNSNNNDNCNNNNDNNNDNNSNNDDNNNNNDNNNDISSNSNGYYGWNAINKKINYKECQILYPKSVSTKHDYIFYSRICILNVRTTHRSRSEQ